MKLTPLEDWIGQKIKCPPLEISRGRIEDYQFDKINETLLHVKNNSSFYKTLLSRFPIHINSFDEFANFPFTSADDLRQYPTQFVCVSQNEISRIVTLNTSGTTGRPKRCFFTSDDQELTIDFFGVGMSTQVKPGNRVLILLPDHTPGSVGDLLFKGLEKIDIAAYKHGPVTDLVETLQSICRLEIDSLVGSPTQILALARFQQFHPTEFPVNIKSVLLSTDYVPESIVYAIRSAWYCDVFNHYGMTEMGLGGGVFCEGQFGYHLREADMFFEIIDPITGRKLPDGELGEVVFTTLTRQGMPLMRYRTGDYSRFLPDPCPCGTILKSLQKISGRIDQHFSINGRSLIISDLDEILFRLGGLINYRLKIIHEKNKDNLTFSIYLLKNDNFSLQNEIISTLLHNEITSGDQLISFNFTAGYPEELWSLRKRKVLEEFI